MQTWIVLLLLTVSPPHVAAQTPRVDTILIIEKGAYRADTLQKTERAGTTGVINTVGRIQLLHSTTNIPALRGVRFGFRYVVIGAPKGAAVELKAVTKFPPAGLRNPETGNTHFQSEYSVVRTIGDIAYREYHLEYDWEVVPGIWTFEFWSGTRKVGEQKFCVHGSQPGDGGTSAAQPRTICGDLLS